MQDLKTILQDKNSLTTDMVERHKYVTKEYQDYGYRLAVQLEDLKHKALYMRLAKNKQRAFLEQAFSFAIDYPKAKNKGRLFMWKLSELEKLAKDKQLQEKEKDQKKLF
jgi:hypothetical protein